jgi:hypothetical protein
MARKGKWQPTLAEGAQYAIYPAAKAQLRMTYANAQSDWLMQHKVGRLQSDTSSLS